MAFLVGLCGVLALPACKGSAEQGGGGALAPHVCWISGVAGNPALEQQWPCGVAWEGFDGEGKSMSPNGAGREGKVPPGQLELVGAKPSWQTHMAGKFVLGQMQ